MGIVIAFLVGVIIGAGGMFIFHPKAKKGLDEWQGS